jgi:hypothetical protein
MRGARAAVAVLLALCVACGNNSNSTERPRSTAKIAIVQPQANDTVHGRLTVRLRLFGGRITKQVSATDLPPDEGHVHLSIDGQIQTMTFGLEQKLKAPKPGRHILQAEFVAKDHGPFSPRVLAATPFTVR